MDLAACLPPELRGATITPLGGGLSGAGVYRVDHGDRAYVLKLSATPLPEWQARVELLQRAAAAGVAPRVVHVDSEHAAVVSDFIVDRGFLPLFFNPQTRSAALAKLGGAIRRVHEVPLPPAAQQATHSAAFLTAIWSWLADFSTPAFVADAVQRVLAEPVPSCDRPAVLSHNDLNPGNLSYDGEHLVFLDWDAAGPNDPFYDLAAVAVFLRMDDATCAQLIAAYDDGPPTAELPARFLYDRRLVAAMCGAIFLHLARKQGHAGGPATLDETPALAEVYQRMRAGALAVNTPAGQWMLGLALAKASLAL